MLITSNVYAEPDSIALPKLGFTVNLPTIPGCFDHYSDNCAFNDSVIGSIYINYDDKFCQNNHRAFLFQERDWNPTNAAESSFDWASFVFNPVYHEACINGDK